MPNPNEIDLLWILICAFLVFLMQLGFALVETGTVRSKNTINVAMKNLIDMIFGIMFFWMVGFGLMFGNDVGGIFGNDLFFIDGSDNTNNGFFFFQVMFAATAITIVSGAVAERMKFSGYVLVAITVISVIYPIVGHWAWGDGGWLKELGFIDFAGSTVVHSVGAWIGLAGAIILGPRIGKFRRGKINYFPPSNHNFIVFGVFILWFAWFGFNAGSLLAFDESVTTILLNTLISGAFGGFGAYLISLFFKQRVSIEIFSFGIISGLVGITAGCAEFTTANSAFVGFISAFVMFASDRFLLKQLHVDDPLSAVAVHGFSGAWGTFAVGLFAALPEGLSRLDFIGIQTLGILSAFVFAFGMGLILFLLLYRFKALRVTKRHELIGLNLAEHNARLPWVDTIESILKIMRSGDLRQKVHEERYTEVGTVAKFFNHLLESLQKKQIELTDSNARLHSKASTDQLTKSKNRRAVMELIDGKNPYEHSYSIIILDIDNFKSFNDTYGHAVGDQVLIELAEHVNRIVPTRDIFARWGGEEFIIIVKTIDLETVQNIADRIRSSIESKDFSVGEKITCSFGVSSPKNATVDFDRLFDQADKALYQAKKLGRNRVCSW